MMVPSVFAVGLPPHVVYFRALRRIIAALIQKRIESNH